tara:strand:- start:916 stop:1236 length:321 start_codon:yes stop_codon:yes gene_type:complete
MLGVETMASVIWSELVAPGLMTPQRFIALLSSAPARIAGLEDHGRIIDVGEPANIAVFDPHRRWVINPNHLQSKSENTPWPDKEVTGRVRHTICMGDLVVHAESLT